MSDNISSNNVSDRREARRQRRAERRGGSWMLGILLILVAVIILMQNLNMITFNNWWALFILLPAVGSLETSWRIYQESGRFTSRARGAAIVGLVLVLVTGMFLLNLNWTILGPVLLILAGLGLFASSLLPE